RIRYRLETPRVDAHQAAHLAAVSNRAERLASEGTPIEQVERKEGDAGCSNDDELLRQDRYLTEIDRLLAQPRRHRRRAAGPDDLGEIDHQEADRQRAPHPDVPTGARAQH